MDVRLSRTILLFLAGALAACSAATPAGPATTPPAATPAGPATTPTAAAPAGPATTATAAGWWRPSPGLTWQWQLEEGVEPSIEADVYDVDLYVEQAVIDELHARGRRVICYVSAGSLEDWRPDAGRFPAEVIGKDYEGWPGESWLDIRRLDLLAPLLRARLDLCAAKGFDGVEPDNIDAFTNDTGFPLTYTDQLTFNQWLAEEAHARGLSIGLKNDGDQAADLLPYFDWALTEDCFADEWCEEMAPFLAAGKPVFAAEYTDVWAPAQFLSHVCSQAAELGFSLILKNRDLDAWRQTCP